MLTLNIDYEVLSDRLVTFKLPETVRLGRHELVIVVVEQPSPTPLVADEKAAKLHEFIRERHELSLSEPLLDAKEIFSKMAARHAG